MQEELYDHRDEKLTDFTHRELENLSRNLTFSRVIRHMRGRLLRFLKEKVVFYGPYPF